VLWHGIAMRRKCEIPVLCPVLFYAGVWYRLWLWALGACRERFLRCSYGTARGKKCPAPKTK
jgi:hypothetical protein